MAANLIEQGLAAVKAGNREEARSFFEQAVAAEPENARAWYYLGRTQTDNAEKRASFERVLDIMPTNTQAQEELAKLPPAAEEESFDFGGFDEPVPASASNNVIDFSAEKPKGPPNNIMMASPTDGFALPIDIPGAPETVKPDVVVNQFVEKFKQGLAILQGKEGAYQEAMRYASWWHFWSFIAVIFVISALVTTINSTIALNQAANAAEQFSELGEFEEFGELGGLFGAAMDAANVARPNPLTIALNFLITIPLSIATLYAGLFAGHWYMTNQANGRATLIQQAYAIMLPVTTASLIAAGLNFIGTLLGPLSIVTGLVSLGLAIYAYWIVAAKGVDMVNGTTGNSKYIALLVQAIAQIVAAAILGIVLSPFLLAGGGLF